MLTLLLGMMFISTNKDSPDIILNSIFIIILLMNITFIVYWLRLMIPVVYPQMIRVLHRFPLTRNCIKSMDCIKLPQDLKSVEDKKA